MCVHFVPPPLQVHLSAKQINGFVMGTASAGGYILSRQFLQPTMTPLTNPRKFGLVIAGGFVGLVVGNIQAARGLKKISNQMDDPKRAMGALREIFKEKMTRIQQGGKPAFPPMSGRTPTQQLPSRPLETQSETQDSLSDGWTDVIPPADRQDSDNESQGMSI